MIIRDGKTSFRSKEQLHSFNFPYQLGTGQQETADDAELLEIEAKEGDVVVMATDGLWDNLAEEEILKIVADHYHSNSGHGEGGEGDTLADKLALAAFSRASSSEEESPFMRHAFLSGFVAAPQGGKMDDITIVVGQVGNVVAKPTGDEIKVKQPS